MCRWFQLARCVKWARVGTNGCDRWDTIASEVRQMLAMVEEGKKRERRKEEGKGMEWAREENKLREFRVSNMNSRGIEVSRVVVHSIGWAHKGEKGMMHWWVLGQSGLPPRVAGLLHSMFNVHVSSWLKSCLGMQFHSPPCLSPTYVLELKGEPTHVVIPW